MDRRGHQPVRPPGESLSEGQHDQRCARRGVRDRLGGTVSRLTGGWQVLSHRALDESRTRRLDGKIIQPYHPFTRAAQKKLARGEVAPIDVEVFPTAATIRPGHRLRLAVQAFDVPHLLPSVPAAPGHLTLMKVHTSDQYPSELTLPTVPQDVS